MGDENAVMKLLLEMMSCMEGETQRSDNIWPMDLSSDSTPYPSDPLISPPLPVATHQSSCSSLSSPSAHTHSSPSLMCHNEDRSPPLELHSSPLSQSARRPLSPLRARREQRRRVLRLAGGKLAALEADERRMLGERCLRQQVLLQNMTVRLAAEARAERTARLAARTRPQRRCNRRRCYSRPLGRSLGGGRCGSDAFPAVASTTTTLSSAPKMGPVDTSPAPVIADDFLRQEGISPPPSPPAAADEDAALLDLWADVSPPDSSLACGEPPSLKRPRLQCSSSCQSVTCPSVTPESTETPCHAQLAGGCGRVSASAAVFGGDFQLSSFYQLVPSLES